MRGAEGIAVIGYQLAGKLAVWVGNASGLKPVGRDAHARTMA